VRKTVLVTAIAVIAAAPARAQQTPDPAHGRELVQQALQQTQQTPAQPAAAAPGATVDLTLQEVAQRALERNIDISVARLNPRLWDFSIAALESNYQPNLTSTVLDRSSTRLPTRQVEGGTGGKLTTGTVSWEGGWAQNLRWGGTSLSGGWQNSRQNSDDAFALRNPSYTSNLTFSITQPLLRGFRIDGTRAALQTARLSQDSDEIALQATIASTVAAARNAYWDLVFAAQAVEVAQQSLDLASKLVQDNQARVEIGTLAPIDVVSAQAEEATRRQALVQAQGTLATSELALNRLIVSGTDDPLWTAHINPVDRPPSTAEPIDLQAAVTRALQERTDLQQAKKTLASNDINLRNRVDQMKPALDLNASYGLAGLGGTQFVRSGLGGGVSQTIPGGYADALRNITGFDAPTWSLQMNFSYPLGTSGAEANTARARLQQEQTQAQLKALELTIATDVTNAALTVRTDQQAVEAATAARDLAQKRLEAAQSKFEVGMATNFEVVQAQRDLRDAQNSELRAILDYRKALVTFEQVQTVSASRGGISAISGGGGGGGSTGGSGGRTGGGGGI
jgi:outer membrane protein TolC